MANHSNPCLPLLFLQVPVSRALIVAELTAQSDVSLLLLPLPFLFTRENCLGRTLAVAGLMLAYTASLGNACPATNGCALRPVTAFLWDRCENGPIKLAEAAVPLD